jgi:tetratricopeptide (TPR) repeat protein
MDFFRGLNKEQWTALLAVAFSCLLLLFGFGGGLAPGAEIPKGGAEEPYIPLKARYVELPDEKFERYWSGKPIFNVESAQKLPIPLLKAPEPREEEMPVPPFRPGPAWEIYNKLPGTAKYPMLTPGAPIVAEANLPTAAEVAELCKIEEPVVQPRPDLRDKKEREFAVVKMKNGGPIEAQKVEIVGEWVVGKRKDGRLLRIPVADVFMPDILQNRTNEEQYRFDSEKLEKYGPKEPDERVKLALRCIEQGMMPEAKAELKKAIEVRKDHLEAILQLGQLAVDASDFETAIATYRSGIDAGGPAGDLWYEIGRCLRAVSFYEGALAAFEKAVESQPRLHRARIALARSHLETGNAALAIESATDFFTKLGTSPDTLPAHRGEAAAVRGMAYVRAGQLDKAHADFAEAIKIDPANAEALNGNGAAFALEGQYPQAGPEFAKAIRANQYLTDAWTNLAALFLMGGKWAEAEQLSQAAAQRDPASVEALLGLGLAQLLGGKKDAPATLARAEQVDPRNLQALMVSGLLLLRQGQDEEALGKFVSALRQEYFFLPAYSGAAAAYLRTARKLTMDRDDAKAKKAAELRINAATLLKEIIMFDKTRPGAWVALGCAYAVMQQPEEARDALRNAKESDPLIFYARGYIEYYYAPGAVGVRLDLAHGEFEQGAKVETTATDALSQRIVADCKTAMDQIDQWKRTSLQLLEEFAGPDAKHIGGGWLEEEANGLAITRENSKEKGGRAKIAGKQALRDWALTSLLHDIPGDEFFSIEMTFFPEKIDKTEFGLAIFHTHQGALLSGFCIGVDFTGKVRFSASAMNRDLDARDTTVGWTEIKTPLPNPKEITIRVTASEKNRAKFYAIWYWNAQKGDWILAQKETPVNPPRGTWKVGAWAHAWRDQDVLLYVKNIKVLNQARR